MRFVTVKSAEQQGRLMQHRVREILLASSLYDSFIFEQMQLPFAERRIPMFPMMREEARAALRAWEEQTDKTPY